MVKIFLVRFLEPGQIKLLLTIIAQPPVVLWNRHRIVDCLLYDAKIFHWWLDAILILGDDLGN